MASINRAAIISKTHKVLAKHFKPVIPAERPVLEQLLYACCLEDANHDTADECFARLQESFFDWNEVRVTAVRELSEMLRGLPEPMRAAANLKHTLHSVFESVYAFDLEALKKQNLGAAIKALQQYRGTTRFTVSYVVQNSLGGHSIPISRGAVDVMYIVAAIDEKEAQKGAVPGLERAIPKSKGVSFASLLQQISAELVAHPFNPHVRSILLEIDPDAKPRLPKRAPKKVAKPKEEKVLASDKKKSKKSESLKKKPAKKTPVSTRKKKSTKSISKKTSKLAKKSASKQLARRKPR